jgi:hypothetical protein
MTSGWIRKVLDAVRTLLTGTSKTTQNEVEREKMAALDAAEQELASLRDRSEKAVEFLDARDNRNHWQESVRQMIRGGVL